ncbi:hypothetical protein [Catenulispora subtropica]|uniref:Integral membrane protein n=1 Tax=Catenulispora subtropica TaxID=450798 RepID=A0ABN2QR77_9ACTN
MSATGPDSPTPQAGDEEVAALHRRVTQLEAVVAARDKKLGHHPVRSFFSAVLIVLASILALLSVVSVWAANTVTDTDQFVSTLGPLVKNPQVQTAVSNRVTDVVLDQANVDQVVDQLARAAGNSNLPPQTQALITTLKGPIVSGLKDLVGVVSDKVVTSDQFATVWNNALRQAHTAFEKALTGQGGGAVSLNDDEVQINIGPAVAQVKDQLVSQGFALASKIPTVNTSFTVYQSKSLNKVKTLFRLLQIIGDWLPIITVLIAAAGVYLARNRRKALIGNAIGVAVAMLFLGLAVTIFRPFFIDQLPTDINTGAAEATYDQLVKFLRMSTRTVGTLAVLVAVGAFLNGPAPLAVWIRAACSSSIGALREVADSAGFKAGAVDRFTARYKHWIGVGILILASAVFVIWEHPTGMVVFWFAFIIVIAFAIREFFAPGPGLIRRDEVAVDDTAGPGPTPA